MTTISQADPTAEAVKNMLSPDQSGISYVMKRYIVEDLASGNANAFAFAVQNPEGVDCIVTNVIVDITTAGGTASCPKCANSKAAPDRPPGLPGLIAAAWLPAVDKVCRCQHQHRPSDDSVPLSGEEAALHTGQGVTGDQRRTTFVGVVLC